MQQDFKATNSNKMHVQELDTEIETKKDTKQQQQGTGNKHEAMQWKRAMKVELKSESSCR